MGAQPKKVEVKVKHPVRAHEPRAFGQGNA